MKKSLKSKNYARLLGVIGQSKEALSASQIICKMKERYPGSDWTVIYDMLDELCPSRYYTFGERMFCVSELFSEDYDIRNKCLASLINKLRKRFQQPPRPRFEIKDDPKTLYTFFEKEDSNKTYVEKDANGKITKVIVEDTHNNVVVINVVFDKPLNITIIYAPRHYPDINKVHNPRTVILLAPKKKSGRVYAYEALVSFVNPVQIQYLNMENNGSSKKYRLNFRGLVLFLLLENNLDAINAVLENLSEVDDTDVEKGGTSEGLPYSIKQNFPFLSIYFADFQKAILSGNYISNTLKGVVKEFESKLHFMDMEELKRLVTRKYYAYIENLEIRNDNLFYSRLKILPRHLLGKRLPRGFNADPKLVSMYKLSILYYIKATIEEDLFLVNEMIKRNEEHLDSISASR